jgi:alpha-2-macroglobulin
MLQAVAQTVQSAQTEIDRNSRQARASKRRRKGLVDMKTRLRVGVLAGPVFFLILSLLPFAVTAQRSTSMTKRVASGDQVRNGLEIRLSEGADSVERTEPIPPAAAVRLDNDETQKILGRLQPIKSDASDEQDFAIRDRSLPPPRTGRTISGEFPPRESTIAPGTTAAGPLEVSRYSPEGDVPLAPSLSVTFSQPMIEVTSHQDSLAGGVPVKLTPEPPGHWRWIGTKTLLFEPDGRFPMSTEYAVEIPAGTTSAAGGALSATKRWVFKTPPVQVKKSYPGQGAQSRDPLIFVEFDQRIDSSAVLEKIGVRAAGREFETRPATADEIKDDTIVSDLAAAAMKDRWLAFRVVGRDTASQFPLPADQQVTITIPAGTPSLEGPRTTTSDQSFEFRTYGPFKVARHECGYRGCTPWDQWRIEFTSTLDREAFDSSQVRIEPEAPGLKAAVYGNTLTINGLKRGRTTYRVQLDAAIRDQFGRTLGETAPIEFNVGPAPPMLTSNGQGFVVSDPAAQPRFSVYSVNHRSLTVRMYSVAPEDWRAFNLYRRRNDSAPETPPGRLVVSKVIEVRGEPDEFVETRIDLTPALEGGTGQVILIVEPAIRSRQRRTNQSVVDWIQVTGIGLDALVDDSDLVGWATSLKDGKPIGGVQLSILNLGRSPSRHAAQVSTGVDGLARLALPTSGEGTGLLVARKGRDVAILPENTYPWADNTGWFKKDQADTIRWHVFDDRKLYRPGEEVHLKGWLRTIGAGKTGDVGPVDRAVETVNYVLKDSRGNEILRGNRELNALGGFDAAFKLPPTMNLGYARLDLEVQGGNESLGGRATTHQIQVQEFRRPEFEVTASASDGPHFVGASAELTVAASYYAGGGLPDAEVKWQVTTQPAHFTPPNRDDFNFGKWSPWWISRNEYYPPITASYDGTTDAAGKHHLHVDFVSVSPPRPSTVTAQASVMDVNRQQWTATTNLLVHPADLYVGIRSPKVFVQKGEPLVLQSIVTDLDGKAIAGRVVSMRAVRLDWVQEKGKWTQKEVDPQECSVKSAADPVECRFATKEGGVFRVTATVMDDRERPNESEMNLWVAGGKMVPKRDVEQEEVNLIPDRRDYQPGDTAEVLLQAPFYPAEGVMTLERSGIVSTERFKMDSASTTLRVPIEDAYIPNIHVRVDLVGAATRIGDDGQAREQLPKRPAFASGELNLPVPPLSRKLTVEATPLEKALEPGGETTVDVLVKDADGKPVAGCEMAVVIVDEAILGLTGYRIADPGSFFYLQRSGDVNAYHLRRDVLLEDPAALAAQVQTRQVGELNALRLRAEPPPAPQALKADRARETGLDGGGGGPGPLEAIRTREDFNPLAGFAPAVPTDSDGRARVKVKLPDNLTRYRITAVAVAGGKQFGLGESAITARLPLMARPSAPRFLNFGDKFELPIVVQNQTDSPMEVDIAVRASNAELSDGDGRRVTVPANDRVEVRFPASAVRAGTARFQIAAASGKWADAAEVELPVWTPATTEAFATYGEIDQGAIAQPVKAPSDAVKQFGGLEITTSSTELQALTDAVLYLTAYPFECAEQLSSRVLAVAALKDVLAAFEAKGLPTPDEMVSAVARDIKRLQSLQNDDGGFGFWRRGDESWPYISVHVAHALQRAKEKGFEVPADMTEHSRDYLRNVERHIPSYYGPAARRAVVAYALYVRSRMGDRDVAKARSLVAQAGTDGLSLEAAGWLLPVLSGDRSSVELDTLRRFINNRVSEEAGTAHFVTSYGDSDYLLLHSDRRADGVILESLIVDQPKSDLIPKVVRGLLGHRKQGRWENTQENAFVLLALDRYFATYEKATPDFVARAWLGQTYAGEHEFKGRTTERYHVNVPMRFLGEGASSQSLILSKDGPGRLYYRIGMQYAPARLTLAASDHGFTVERRYEAVDKADDVRRDADGTWHVRAGAMVRVKLTMVAPTRRYHVALVDPMPAGFEALNPELAVTGTIPKDPASEETKRGWWWVRPWFEHQNLRDERAEAFTSLLWEGVYTYSYVARATTPGVFIAPPAKAEEMYHPETFGRGATDKVVVD